ncbi:MCE family protein [Rhodococcus sp. KBS0724]|uniref:MCE family protein n=1 Tax=Rhodococcus sp. KBS0724 TaxID=1179674 RepID=UPI00110D58E1|nr:MCE family protein [Rhodococcus sp. KBS0724]TSD50268.1 MCE family protein [Rhodococcus sp. KBS0724]
MFLVKLIDVFVGIMLFLFKGDRRQSGSGTALALGSLGIVVLVVGLAAALGIPKLWYNVRTSAYTAEFSNAGGLSDTDPVYVAGVPAGRVDSIELAGDHVVVSFRLDKDQPLGNQSTATVRLKTVLGKRYLEVVPAGVVDDTDGRVIPLSRTTAAYSLDDVSTDATQVATGVDLQAMESMMNTLAQVIPTDSDQVGRALAGISGASAAFAQNGEQIDQVLTMSRELSDMAVAQTDSIVNTAANAQTIVRTLALRKDALTQLVDNLTIIISKLSTTFTERESEFGELTDNLVAVTTTLKNNADQIDMLMTRLPSALRSVTDATGTGDWTDVNAPAAVIPDNLLCALGIMEGCK